MTKITKEKQWPQFSNRAPVTIPTVHGKVQVQLAELENEKILVITSGSVSSNPVVRFQSSCVFGEGLRALDCDCGEQLDASVKSICENGGIITYAWEEGRGVGIAKKLDAIALQDSQGLNTAEAFKAIGCKPEPRDFKNHIAALRLVFSGTEVRLGSRNPHKIAALETAGFRVSERFTPETKSTDERQAYLASKIAALGHLG